MNNKWSFHCENTDLLSSSTVQLCAAHQQSGPYSSYMYLSCVGVVFTHVVSQVMMSWLLLFIIYWLMTCTWMTQKWRKFTFLIKCLLWMSSHSDLTTTTKLQNTGLLFFTNEVMYVRESTWWGGVWKLQRGVGWGHLTFFYWQRRVRRYGMEIWGMEFSSENLQSLHPPSQQSTFP